MTRKKPSRATPPERSSGLRNVKDRREAVETILRAFTNPQDMERHMRDSLWREPIFDPEHTRITVARGRVVAAVVMGPRQIRFGPVSVPALTIGPVGTHDRYRKRGYAAAAMNDATDYMKENAVLAAYLQGIPDFYFRFGYYPFMAPGNAKFNREEARKEMRAGRLRIMTRQDLPAVSKLHTQATAERICAADRDPKLWDWLLGPGGKSWLFSGPRVILDARGRPCGYLTLNPKGELRVREIVVKQDEPSCRAALGALVREAKRRETKEITLPLPWNDALAVFLRQYVGAEFKMWSNPTSGALLKIVDFPALMRKLEPLFARRWQAAPTLADTAFTLESEIGAVGFTLSHGGVRVANRPVGKPGSEPCAYVPARWLSGLLTGYYSVADVAPRQGSVIPAELKPALEVLFPPAWPYVYQADNY